MLKELSGNQILRFFFNQLYLESNWVKIFCMNEWMNDGKRWFKNLWFRTSHQKCSIKKVLLKLSQNSQENTCARASFLIKLQASGCNFIKKRLWHRCFLVSFPKIFKVTYFYRATLVAASGSYKLVSFFVIDNVIDVMVVDKWNQSNFKVCLTRLWFVDRGLWKLHGNFILDVWLGSEYAFAIDAATNLNFLQVFHQLYLCKEFSASSYFKLHTKLLKIIPILARCLACS